jgi:hypothetical protein
MFGEIQEGRTTGAVLAAINFKIKFFVQTSETKNKRNTV